MRDEAKQEQPCPYNSYSKGAGKGGGGGRDVPNGRHSFNVDLDRDY